MADRIPYKLRSKQDFPDLPSLNQLEGGNSGHPFTSGNVQSSVERVVSRRKSSPSRTVPTGPQAGQQQSQCRGGPSRANIPYAAGTSKQTARLGQQSTARQGQQSTARQGQRNTARRGQQNIGNQGQQYSAGQGQQNTARQGPQNTARQGPQNTARQGQQNTARQGQQNTGRQGQQNTGRQGQQNTAGQGPQNTGRQGPQNTARQGQQNTARRGPQNTGRQGQQNIGRRGQQNTGRQGPQNTGRQGPQNIGRQGQQNIGRRGQQNTGRQGQQNTGKQGQQYSTTQGQQHRVRQGQQYSAGQGQQHIIKQGLQNTGRQGQQYAGRWGQQNTARQGQQNIGKQGQQYTERHGRQYTERGDQQNTGHRSAQKISRAVEFEDLQDMMDKLNKTANEWFLKQAEEEYPYLNAQAYAVPAYFTGSSTTKCDWQGPPEFLSSTVPDSTQRGDRAQCAVATVFRIYSQRQELLGEAPMFIIGPIHYDHLLAWLKRPPPELKKKFRDVFEKLCCPEGLVNKRGDLDLLGIHPEKGVFFVQIKATCGAYASEVAEVISKATEQLENDASIFKMVMEEESFGHRSEQEGRQCKTIKVIALPNMTRKDIASQIEANKDMIFLCKDDLPEELHDVGVPDSEMVLDKFKCWLDKILGQRIDPAFMKEIVGKYAGCLSTVVKFKDGNKTDRLRTMSDCVRDTGRLFKRPILSQRQIETSKKLAYDDKCRQIYISGPPGSGKTSMLVLQALMYLFRNPTHHVIVVSMYRGASCLSTGHSVLKQICQSGSPGVRHLEIDMSNGKTDRESFVAKVKNLAQIPKQSYADAVASKQNKTSGSNMTVSDIQPSDLMFVVDEMCIDSSFLSSLKKEFPESKIVASSGFPSKCPEGFVEFKLDLVLRITPSVQKLLYHTDPDTLRKGHYKGVCSDPAVPTRGFPPVCIRHKQHVPQVSVTECTQCALDLIEGLRVMGLEGVMNGKKTEEKAGTCGGKHAEDLPSCAEDLKVTVLINIPRKLYRVVLNNGGEFIETTSSRYLAYMKYITSCPFISTLLQQGIQVTVKYGLSPDDHADKRQQVGITATWVYIHKEASDVVIFLPGDTPYQETQPEEDNRQENAAENHSENGREIPLPGFGVDSKDNTGGTLPIVRREDLHSASLHLASFSQEASCASQKSHVQEDTFAAHTPASLQWSMEDIGRLSDWDKTSLTFAGSQCRSLLFIIVP